MTREEALKTLEENICNTCNYGSKNMELCDIRYCDCKEAIETLKHETKENKDIKLPLYKINDRLEYGTDGNIYKLSMSNGKELEKQNYEILPTATPYPNTGYRIISDLRADNKSAKMSCSNCGAAIYTNLRFCPYCGTWYKDMKIPTDSEMESEDKE
jgi:hypothetical protein